MKVAVTLCVLVFVGLALADIDLHPRGCIYIMGECFEECEEGTHSYNTDCTDRMMPEATCETPNPVLEDAMICDYSACHCDPPTVRDVSSGKCVPLSECPKKE